MKNIVYCFFLLLFFFESNAQNYSIADGMIKASSGYFYDSGGSSGKYKGGEEYVCVIATPETGSKLIVRFLQFNLGEGDWLAVYDGSSIGSDLIDTYSIENPIEGDISASEGNLTFVFHSDNDSDGSGWEAYISYFGESNALVQYNAIPDAKVQLIYKITGLLSADEGDKIELKMQNVSFVKFCEATVEKEIIVVNVPDISYINEARHSILEICHNLGVSANVEFIESVTLNK